MGLDMHLNKRIYIGAEYDHNNVKGNINITKGDREININSNKVSYVIEEAIYWRKANAIHKWFVENVQDNIDDCNEYDVSRAQLESLLNDCKSILNQVIVKQGKVVNGIGFKTGPNGELIQDPHYEPGRVVTNPEVCENILPTGEGFFFGSYDYDEWYLSDLEYTVEELEKILKEPEDKDSSFTYQSSW